MFTLHVEHVVLLGLFTVLTLINCRLHDGARDGYWFPAYTLSAFTGAVFVALRRHGLPDAASIVLGVAFFHLAYLFLHRGLNGFFPSDGVERWPLLVQLGAVLLGLVVVTQFGLIHPDTQRRVVWYSFIFCFQTALVAVLLFRRARGHLAVPGALMGGVMALLSLNNLMRAIATLYEGVPADYMKSGLTQQISLLCMIVLQSGAVVAYVWMTAAVLHDQLDTLASTDSLTGLLNRRALELAVRRELLLSRKRDKPAAAILIDLDRFKQVNDSFGHSFGDEVLRQVARSLQKEMRQSDLLARVGGDEFAVMLCNTSGAEAMEIAERLRSSLAELVVADGEMEARVSASFGLAQADGSTSDWTELVRKCDKAVYAVKGIGGNLAVAN